MYSGRLKKNHDEDVSFRVADRPAPGELEAISDGISRYNHDTTGEHRDSCFLTVRCGNRLIGGMEAVSAGYNFYIKKLWIDSLHRGKGVGRILMEKAEVEARERQCVRMWVDTLDFQAPSFYEKCGYKEAARVPGYRNAHDRIFFVKDIAQANDNG